MVPYLLTLLPAPTGQPLKMTTSKAKTAAIMTASFAVLAVLAYESSSGSTSRKPATIVSQKGRIFSVASLHISPGDTIRIVNDDADLQHHAYIDSNDFRFDSGDQEPGGSADITFPAAGTFTVLCGIHPKMKLVVNVK